MMVRIGLLALVAAGVLGAASTGGAVGSASPAVGALRAFDGCPSFLAHVRSRALPLIGPYGLVRDVGIAAGGPPIAARGDRSAAPATPEYSGTNVQEEGVDEPDLVKTNGRTLFAVAGGRVSAVDVGARRPRLLSSVRLAAGWQHELLLHGDRLLVLSQGASMPIPSDGRVGIRAPWPYPARTKVMEIDVGDPARLRLVRTLELAGGYLTARLVGSTARIVLSSSVGIDLPYVQPRSGAAADAARATEQNRHLAMTAGPRRWLPGFTVRSRGRVVERGSLVECRDVSRPRSFSGLGLLSVVTFGLDRGLERLDADAILSDGRTVYASRTSLYVATERFDRRLDATRPIPETTTAIHRFDISRPDQTSYRASGAVPGVLLGQWSLSERSGVLRVATTEQPVWWGGPQTESESAVVTLGERGGALVQLGKVGGLGKGERIYSVRFVGDTAYVVTFRQVDPLYTVDLSVPSLPAVRGELKIRGYSAYLHPLGDDLLLGVGQDATAEGRVLGTQVSLFDVSDLRRPRRLDTFSLGVSWSEAESDHHAFLWWPRTRTAVLPLQETRAAPFAGAVGLRIGRTGISELGRVSHPKGAASAIRRSVVVGDTLYTVSEEGVGASSLSTLAELGFARLGG